MLLLRVFHTFTLVFIMWIFHLSLKFLISSSLQKVYIKTHNMLYIFFKTQRTLNFSLNGLELKIKGISKELQPGRL